MKNEFVAALIVVLIVAGVGAGYFFGRAESQVAAGSGCADQVSPQPSNVNYSDAFILSPPSESKLCVVWALPANGNKSNESWNFAAGISSYIGENGTLVPCNNGCAGINASVSPISVSYHRAPNVTATYTVSASKGAAQGVYWMAIGGCEWIPLVIGPIPNDISRSAIPLCSPTLYSTPPTFQIVGVSNMDVVVVACGPSVAGPVVHQCGYVH
jgi:hypothetical protein